MIPPAAPLPSRKKSNLLLWIILGVGGLVIIVGIGVIATGFFIAHKVKQAGFDTDLIKSNPAMAVTKMIATMNPDVEVLAIDDKSGMIKIKDKKSGKVTEINFEDAKNGNFSIKGDDGKEGTVSISGGGGKRPEWVPVYPGAKQQSNFSSTTAEGDNGTIAFTVEAPPKEIADFYRDKLKAGGFTMAAEFSGGGDAAGSMMTAEDKAHNRQIHVVIGGEEKTATVSVTFTEKKN